MKDLSVESLLGLQEEKNEDLLSYLENTNTYQIKDGKLEPKKNDFSNLSNEAMEELLEEMREPEGKYLHTQIINGKVNRQS